MDLVEFDAAAKEGEGEVVLEGGGLRAHPAELVGAEPALHVIATGFLLDLGAAHRAELYVHVVIAGPLLELLLQVGLT